MVVDSILVFLLRNPERTNIYKSIILVKIVSHPEAKVRLPFHTVANIANTALSFVLANIYVYIFSRASLATLSADLVLHVWPVLLRAIQYPNIWLRTRILLAISLHILYGLARQLSPSAL